MLRNLTLSVFEGTKINSTKWMRGQNTGEEIIDFLLTTTRFLNSSGLEKTTHLSIVYGSSIHYFRRLYTLLENPSMRFVLFLKELSLQKGKKNTKNQ